MVFKRCCDAHNNAYISLSCSTWCMYGVSFFLFLSLYIGTKNRSLHLSVGFTGWFLSRIVQLSNLLASVGILDVFTNSNAPISKIPSIYSFRGLLFVFQVYRGSHCCIISDGSSVSSWYVRLYHSTLFISCFKSVWFAVGAIGSIGVILQGFLFSPYLIKINSSETWVT